MPERIQTITSRGDRYGKGERKAIDEQNLEAFWEFDDPTQQCMLAEVSIQLVRLATVSATYTAPPDKQLSLVFEAIGNSDIRAAHTHQTHPPQLWKYRRNVTAALVFVVNKHFPERNIQFQLPEDTVERLNTLESLEERSQKIKRRISHPEVMQRLAEYPHIAELLEYYARYNDIKPLLDEHGITYGKESRPNDSIKAFLFGNRRKGSKRPYEGVGGIEAWGRKLVFARWCRNSSNFWGVDASGKISRTAAYLTSHSIPKGHELYSNYYGARRFFEKVLEIEFRNLIKRIPRSSASGLPYSHSDRFHDSG